MANNSRRACVLVVGEYLAPTTTGSVMSGSAHEVRAGSAEELPGKGLPGEQRLALCQRLLLTWASGYLKAAGIFDKAASENLVQETCLKVLQSSFDWNREDDHLRASLRRCLINLVRDELRLRRKRQGDYGIGSGQADLLHHLQGSSGGLGRDLERSERLEIVRAAVMRVRALFSDREWAAFHRRVVDGKTLDETAGWVTLRYPSARALKYNKVRSLCSEISSLLSAEIRAADIDLARLDPKTFPEQLRPILQQAADQSDPPPA